MIPTAEVLASILNDPAIPSEAKPEVLRDQQWDGYNDWERLESDDGIWADASRINADLFWSFSAWLWERPDSHYLLPQMNGTFYACYDGQFYPTPTEALAAVVRQVASTTVPTSGG